MKILIIDEQQSYRDGMKKIIEMFKEGITVVTTDFRSIEQYSFSEKIDVVLVEPFGTRKEPIEIIKTVTEMFPYSKVGVLSLKYDINFINQLLETNVLGVILKSELTQTLFDVLDSMQVGSQNFNHQIMTNALDSNLNDKKSVQGKITPSCPNKTQRPLGILSRREWQILELMTKGYSNVSIAQQLFISDATVAQHIGNIFKKLRVTNRVSAVMKAVVNNWIDESVYKNEFE